MTAQRHLFKPGPATAGLTDRQACALELLQSHPGGLRSIDLGRKLHIAFPRGCVCREADGRAVSCAFAHASGQTGGKALRKKDLAIKRRTGLWQATVRAAADLERAATDLGIWPEGF